jgi:hypothetical protein
MKPLLPSFYSSYFPRNHSPDIFFYFSLLKRKSLNIHPERRERAIATNDILNKQTQWRLANNIAPASCRIGTMANGPIDKSAC